MSFLSDLHELSYEEWLNRYEAPRSIDEWMALKANSALGYYASTPTTAIDAYGNTKLGENALDSLPAGDGLRNVALGQASLSGLMLGNNNVAVGQEALLGLADGSDNVAVGEEALMNLTEGVFNTALGDGAGKADGVTTINSGLFLGRNAKPLEDGSDNEVVIGASVTGHGSNTTTIGNSSTTHTFVSGVVILKSFTVAGLPTASSYTGGLVFVSNGTGNKRLAVSDGTNWRFPDGNVVS